MGKALLTETIGTEGSLSGCRSPKDTFPVGRTKEGTPESELEELWGCHHP